MKNPGIKILILLVCSPCLLFAQGERNNWYLEGERSISFNSGAPALTIHNQFRDFEPWAGHVSISDENGNLLFISDGKKAWDKNLNVMVNGEKIDSPYHIVGFSHPIAIPFLHEKDKYYLFTSLSENDGSDPGKWKAHLFYSIIDMSQNNGLGAVISGPTLVKKNIAGALQAIKHPTKDQFWLLSLEYSGGGIDSTFAVFAIEDDIVNTSPVISNTGVPFQSYEVISNNLKISNTGKYVSVNHYLGFTEILDFNICDGRLSNARSLPTPPTPNSDYPYFPVWGMCFSPNDSFFYASYRTRYINVIPDVVAQYTATDNFTQAHIVADASKHIQDGGNFIRHQYIDLTLGPDEKIYLYEKPLNNSGYFQLDVIKNPNASRAASDFKEKELYQDDNYISSTTYAHFPAFATIPTAKLIPGFDVEQACLPDSAVFFVHNLENMDSAIFEFGDSDRFYISDKQTGKISHFYKSPGGYFATLKYYKCGNERMIRKPVAIAARLVFDLGGDTGLCPGAEITLTAPVADSVRWSTGSVESKIEISSAGKYALRVYKGGCLSADSIEIDYYPSLWTALGEEYFICDEEGELAKLDAGEGFDSYLWVPTGDTTQWIKVGKIGDYLVIVEDFRGCKGEDSSVVKRRCNFSFFVPGAFSPDGNGLNEVFKPVYNDITSYNMDIFNRWGQKIYSSTDPEQGWDGSFLGQWCQQDVYVWMVSFKGYQNKLWKKYNYTGCVTLMR